jgi:hypothetical protein
MKQRFVRPGDSLSDDTVIVVRGGSLDQALLATDAERMHSVYGIFGISVFAVRSVPLDELAQQSPLVRFSRLPLMTAGAVRAAGLALEPTGRNAEHFTIVFPELEEGVAALVACEHRTIDNPYHEE